MSNFSSSLPLSQIIITGKRVYTTDFDIQQSVLSVGLMGTFMTQDIRLIQKRIKSIPWVQQVSVRKQWPNKIKIYIIEYVPVAYWNVIYVLTRDAVLFTIPESRIGLKLLPKLSGPKGSERCVLSGYYIFDQILEFTGFNIRSVNMTDCYSWEIILEDGVKLILGRRNNIARLQRFIKIYPVFLKKYIRDKCELISYIDLRYESGFSVRKMVIIRDKN